MLFPQIRQNIDFKIIRSRFHNKPIMNIERPNPRYKHFRQKIFTSGDVEQFVSSIQNSRKNIKRTNEEDEKIPESHPIRFFKYSNNLLNTFTYIFEKFKKGIYVQIINNEITIFLPFSNANYCNPYPSKTFHVDTRKYKDFQDMCRQLCLKEGRTFQPHKINRHTNQWYCNNGLVRYEFPIQENDSGIDILYSMLQTLCKYREISDCEFFLNKRDFPLLKKNFTDPYEALVGENVELSLDDLSFMPILSMCSTNKHADMIIPTWEDWMRASFQHDESMVFPDYKGNVKTYPKIPVSNWLEKRPVIVFRGASTGLGTNTHTNPRLYFSKLALKYPDILDIGITKWNLRPRKNSHTDFLEILDDEGIPLKPFMTPLEQSNFRYILHLPGHSAAYRLSYELSMNSVIFLYPCEYNLWFTHLLEPYKHYIPLEKKLTEIDILKKFEWCQSNPETCVQISKNAREFYDKYLSFDSILDYCQDIFRTMNLWMTQPTNYVEYVNHLHQKEVHGIYSNEVFEIKNILHKSHRSEIYQIDPLHTVKLYKDSTCLHEFFVSSYLNSMSLICPSFLKIHTLINPHQIKMEYFQDGMTLETFINDKNLFSFSSLLQISQQILLALHLSQKLFGFMHYDLCPWNILLIPNKKNIPVYFRFPNHDISLMNHKYIVKILDFDKSHIVSNTMSYFHSVPCFLSSVHDIKCFWYHVISIILSKHRISTSNIRMCIDIVNMISGNHFTNIMEIKQFLFHEKKYCNLSKPHKHSFRMSSFKYLFKSDISKKTCNNINLYKTIVDSFLETDNQDLFDDIDIFQHDYLDSSITDMYPMFSSNLQTPFRTTQYQMVYKSIKFVSDGNQMEIPSLRKKLFSYFNFI